MRNPRHTSSLWMLLLALAALALTPACGSDDGGDDNTDPDTTQDTTPLPDTTQDTAPLPDTVDPPTPGLDAPVEVGVVYSDIDLAEAANLYLIDSRDGALATRRSDLDPVTGADIDCSIGQCWISQNGKHFMYYDDRAQVLHRAPLADTITAADLTTIDVSVENLQSVGDRVVYTSLGSYFYVDLSADAPTPINLGTLVINEPGVNFIGNGVTIGKRGDYLLVFRYDLGSLWVYRKPLDDSGDEVLAFVLGIPRLAGSFFGANNVLAVTDDGQDAILMVEGLTLYETCAATSDCAPGAECHFSSTTDGQQTSEVGLCGARRRTLYRFELPPQVADLEQRCEVDTECDPRHRCVWDPASLLSGSPTRKCAPRALDLGPVGSFGDVCNTVQFDEYVDVLPKLRFNADDELLMLTRNDCDANAMSQDALIAIGRDLDPASLRVVEGAYENDFGPQFCWDEQEDIWSYDQCALELRDFEVGPDGHALALIASDRNNVRGSEVWLYDSDDNKYPLTFDTFNEVRDISLFNR